MLMRAWALGDPTSNTIMFLLGYTRNFSPTFLNELLIGVNRNNNSSGTLADFTDWPARAWSSQSFWCHGLADALRFMEPIRGDTGIQTIVAINNLLQSLAEDNATWIKGKHTFQFGGKYRPEQNNVRELQQAQGSHNWGDGAGWTSLWDPAEGQACVLHRTVGLPTWPWDFPISLSNQFNRGYFYFRQTELGALLQRQLESDTSSHLELRGTVGQLDTLYRKI